MSIREKVFIVIFGTNTKAGRRFDILLLWCILASVLLVVLESVKHIQEDHFQVLFRLEWFFTVLFSIEYILRVFAHPKPLKYILSFYGIIDLLAILPSYIGLCFSGTHYLLVIRTLRLLRVFRVLKLGRHLKEGQMLLRALSASIYKITVFFGAVLTIALIMGTTMYMVEGEQNGFSSIPESMYWAIVTITTVGYGDMSPITPFGKFLASVAMIVGYCIIAVPTGIFVAELDRENKQSRGNYNNHICKECGEDRHFVSSNYCHKCGQKLDELD